MIAAVFRYYFLPAEDIDHFIEQMASPLQAAGYRLLTGYDENGLPGALPFEPVCWQFAAGLDSSVLALAYCPQGSPGEALAEIKSLEQQAGVDLDMILGEAALVLAPGQQNWEELVQSCAATVGGKPGAEIAVSSGRLMRYALSPTQTFYIACPDVYDAQAAVFWGQRLAQIEAQQLSTAIVSRLLRDQLTLVKRENTSLERELSLILHANLVSLQGEQKEADELDTQLQALTSAYGKIAGSRHLVTQGKARLQTLANQLTRRLRQDAAFRAEQPLFDTWLEALQERLEQLSQAESALQSAQQDHQAAIEVVRSRIDMMNNRSNLATQAQIRELMEQNTAMQKQSLVFQYAAGLIEFIVLAYYSHSLWKNLAHGGYEVIPAWAQFILVLLFSGNAVYCTHLLAEYMQGEHEVKSRMVISLAAMVLLLLVIIIGTVMVGMPGGDPGAAVH